MENIMNPTLEQVLASVIQQLANFFGTTTTAVMNGMPEFLTAFAWYYTINNAYYIPIAIIAGIIIATFVWLIIEDCDIDEVKFSKCLKTGLFIGLGVGLFFFVKNIALCIICPEIVGGMALLDKLDYLIK